MIMTSFCNTYKKLFISTYYSVKIGEKAGFFGLLVFSMIRRQFYLTLCIFTFYKEFSYEEFTELQARRKKWANVPPQVGNRGI